MDFSLIDNEVAIRIGAFLGVLAGSATWASRSSIPPSCG
jgi:hypothetical protein